MASSELQKSGEGGFVYLAAAVSFMPLRLIRCADGIEAAFGGGGDGAAGGAAAAGHDLYAACAAHAIVHVGVDLLR